MIRTEAVQISYHAPKEPDDFPTLDRIKCIFNKDTFKDRLLEEKRLSKLQFKKRNRKS